MKTEEKEYMLVPLFCQKTGYTDRAVRIKIQRGVWIEGKHYKRAPDGHISIDYKAYQRWVDGTDAMAA